MSFSKAVLGLVILALSAISVFALPTNNTSATITSSYVARGDAPNPCYKLWDATSCLLQVVQHQHSSNVEFAVFDAWCKHIGDATSSLGCKSRSPIRFLLWQTISAHVSIDSELPWTIEMDISNTWDQWPAGAYAATSLGQTQPGCLYNNYDSQFSCLMRFACRWESQWYVRRFEVSNTSNQKASLCTETYSSQELFLSNKMHDRKGNVNSFGFGYGSHSQGAHGCIF